MTDEKIEEIYTLVENALDRGQEAIDVHIFPFRMVEDRMLQYSDNEWYNFWGNLKEGYDYFEEGRIPPTVDVVNRRYEFE
jgi:murein L,D-transpeptidase YafK